MSLVADVMMVVGLMVGWGVGVSLDDVLSELGELVELFVALFAGVHDLDGLEELVEVEAPSVIVCLGALEPPEQVDLFLGEQVDSTAA